MNNAEYAHLLHKAEGAKQRRGEAWAVSRGEELSVAMGLSQPDWITSMWYTLAEAVDRIGPEWMELVPRVECLLAIEDQG
ncbi:MAG: hypothetical protein J0H15_10760 [Xanthomonadales bacterium]|nr:hypothetical protein [Xanthomonadales bacterium]